MNGPEGAEALVVAEADLDRAVAAVAGDGVTIRGTRPVGGGDINEARLLELSDGRRLFLKRNALSLTDLFLEEVRGLLALAECRAVRVPRPLALFSDRTHQHLVMEYIAPGARNGRFWATFGRALAQLHRAARSPRCGFFRDNYIGATRQTNDWSDDWYAFFAARRLVFQVRLARGRGLADEWMERATLRLAERVPELLPPLDDGEASLLHGDLWGGNTMADGEGNPVLIDPATYYGHREADVAMTQLFGGFPEAFFRAYDEAWPLPPGFAERRDIYNLYHLFNHLNLFGAGYAGSCKAILRRFS
ncbi:MAG: fructosamine kinase family protein [Spirochaetales bacterium]|nr:fructosamine kinase family protein [Spirochaetales bacterium]